MKFKNFVLWKTKGTTTIIIQTWGSHFLSPFLAVFLAGLAAFLAGLDAFLAGLAALVAFLAGLAAFLAGLDAFFAAAILIKLFD